MSNNDKVISGTAPKRIINSIMSFLPDNRPITSLQIVEDYEKCPKNFTPINRTYDQDADADLWRESIILFGRQTTRYLCLSKTEGLPDYVLETLIILSEKTAPPKGFSLLTRTVDTEQRAWRKRRLSYKLSKKCDALQAITDIILCSKLKIAPYGFKMAGDINGILVCYKTSTYLPTLCTTDPLTQGNITSENEIRKALNGLNLFSGNNHSVNTSNHVKQCVPPISQPTDHEYEEIQTSFKIKFPQRPAPKPPICTPDIKCGTTNSSYHNIGTLHGYMEIEGVPFIINPQLKPSQQRELRTLPKSTDFILRELNDYDFQLERQTLCTMKSAASKNPFFQ